MLRKILQIAGGLAVVVFVGLAVFAINLVWFRPWSLRLFYEKVFVSYALENPELLSSVGTAEKFGYRAHNAHLNDASVDRVLKDLERARRNLADLARYDLGRQSPAERLSTRILTWYLENLIEGGRFAFHNYPVNQLFGIQSGQPDFMINIHRIPDRKGAEHYLARLGEWGRKFDQVIAGLRYREERRITPPRFVVQRVLTEMRRFVAKPPRENVLFTTFAKKVDELTNLPDADKAALKSRAEAAITSGVYPAYRRLIDTLAALEPKTSTDDGVWKLPEGDAFYAHQLRTFTTTKMTPQEVHELGLREVARIAAEMRAILDAQGHTGGTPGEWLQRLAREPRFLHANDDAGRQAALAEYTRLIEEALVRSRDVIGLAPKAKIEIRRIPEFKEATAPGAYYQRPALDGSRPGVFYANLRDMGEVPKFNMKTLAYHEGVPGHHFQLAIAQETKGLPTFRSLLPFTAYIEGWALYTEWLAVEMGLYQDDPYSSLGRLQDEMMRAVRLVVDTGLHFKRWPREQAIRYMVEHTGMAEASVVSEVERYIVNPGQACAYKIGMLKIQELRRRAEKALGPRFDRREFHDVVLKNGAVPLEILETLIDEWIAVRAGVASST
ncbi:MAG: DUF885 domain-containing protein [Verrucomicrobia bacterium]|nr:DUF885 domain-containing protein [Verrucomicrobiota bacterium]